MTYAEKRLARAAKRRALRSLSRAFAKSQVPARFRAWHRAP